MKDESTLFIFLTWVTSITTVSHIIYGTLIFSSILFISTSDAVQIVARFVASTVVCRVILVFEITGMQQRVGTMMQHPAGNAPSENGAGLKGGCMVEVRALDGRQETQP